MKSIMVFAAVAVCGLSIFVSGCEKKAEPVSDSLTKITDAAKGAAKDAAKAADKAAADVKKAAADAQKK